MLSLILVVSSERPLREPALIYQGSVGFFGRKRSEYRGQNLKDSLQWLVRIQILQLADVLLKAWKEECGDVLIGMLKSEISR